MNILIQDLNLSAITEEEETRVVYMVSKEFQKNPKLSGYLSMDDKHETNVDGGTYWSMDFYAHVGQAFDRIKVIRLWEHGRIDILPVDSIKEYRETTGLLKGRYADLEEALVNGVRKWADFTFHARKNEWTPTVSPSLTALATTQANLQQQIAKEIQIYTPAEQEVIRHKFDKMVEDLLAEERMH